MPEKWFALIHSPPCSARSATTQRLVAQSSSTTSNVNYLNTKWKRISVAQALVVSHTQQDHLRDATETREKQFPVQPRAPLCKSAPPRHGPVASPSPCSVSPGPDASGPAASRKQADNRAPTRAHPGLPSRAPGRPLARAMRHATPTQCHAATGLPPLCGPAAVTRDRGASEPQGFLRSSRRRPSGTYIN